MPDSPERTALYRYFAPSPSGRITTVSVSFRASVGARTDPTVSGKSLIAAGQLLFPTASRNSPDCPAPGRSWPRFSEHRMNAQLTPRKV